MLTILVLFLGLTLATAVIAYWSDNLGKKLGKKRVSLWGMRPRTTATFLTIASSWLIMTFTLGVMLTLFPLLRQSLLHYEDVKKKENDLKISAGKLTGQVGALGGQVETLKARFDKASDNLNKVSAELDRSSKAATRARKEQKQAEKEAATARTSANTSRARERAAVEREKAASASLQNVTNQRDATQQQRDAAQSELKAAQTELDSATAAVNAANARVQAADGRVTKAQNKARQAENQFKKAQTDLTKVQTDLSIAKTNEETARRNEETSRKRAGNSERLASAAERRADEAGKRAEAAKQQAFASDKNVLAAEKQVIEAQKSVDQLRDQRRELIRLNAQLADAKQFSDLRTQLVQGSDIRVPFGFTLVARTFEPGLSFTEATQRLRSIFNYAATEVVPGNKKNPPILPDATLRLASQPVPLPKEKESDPDAYVLAKEDDIYKSLATVISRSQTPLSVRLVADRNHIEDEQFLDARFIIVPERLALRADTELARATFSEKFSDARLFSALIDLADAGREVARQSGVTPPLSPDAKDFYAPGSTEQIFEALRKISAMGGRARVSIITDKAISTTDQLSVRFDIEPLAPSTPTASASTKASASAPRAATRKAPA